MSAIEIKFENGEIAATNTEKSKNLSAILTSGESRAANIIEDALSEIGVSPTEFCYRRNSQSYLSVVTHDVYDFLRLKIGQNTTWFTVFLSPDLRKSLGCDPRFDAQKNKRQFHWKVELAGVEDLANCKDLIQYGYQSAIWSYEKSK